MGVACQKRPADSITVTVDGDGAEIAELVAACAVEFGRSIHLVMRKHTGVCRSAQVRNNGARAAMEAAAEQSGENLPANDRDALVFFDGDCSPVPENLAAYERLLETPTRNGSRKVDLVLGHWVTLTPEQTAAFDEGALKAGKWPVMPSDEELKKLPRRQRRYLRQMFLRRLGLSKGHKPKLASGNFAIRASMFRLVNGFDELYEGYGQEDDDLGRRVYRAGGRAAMGVDTAIVLHQWHPTRQPGAWQTAPGVDRFKLPYEIKAERGLMNPVEQESPVVRWCGGGTQRLAAQHAG